MQINNILDFDDEASAKAYNFTITAIKEFYDTIESDQFTAAGGDTIYAYLTKVMELVSFKEQLKRYIYEASGTREPYSKMDYSAFMLAAFEKNDCMAGKSKSELKRQINRWLNAETIKRENLFLIGFGLRSLKTSDNADKPRADLPFPNTSSALSEMPAICDRL